jgi:hypothetical protein
MDNNILDQGAYTDLNNDNIQYELYDLDIEDNKLAKMLIPALQENIDHWNSKPFELAKTDKDNNKYMLGEQLDEKFLQPHNARYIDNRIFAAARSVLAYVNARVAMPEVVPSKPGSQFKQFSEDFKSALYQHGVDAFLNIKVKSATRNLIVRKRGFLKLRFDPTLGQFGEIVVESIDPENVVIDRYARFQDNPRAIYHKQTCTVEELIAKFPDKEDDIKKSLGIKRGTQSQVTARVDYYEVWFTYIDKEKKKQEGLAWFMPIGQLILGKMRNPNWVYSDGQTNDMHNNITNLPIKPFIPFNYLNSGKSYIDETSLFDQAKPMQDLINKRGRQIWDNADYVNGRVIADSRIMSEEDASKFLNKNPKTIMLVDGSKGSGNISNDMKVVEPQMLPGYVIDTLYDARNELDQIFGTPNIFRGQQQQGANTLGENMLIKQQAGALQDDIAGAVDQAMGQYYKYLAQMMKVYYTEEHWVQTKGPDGTYDFVVISSDNIDTGVKVSVQSGSTLPQDKDQLRNAALELAKLGPDRIDNLTLFEMLGIPDATEVAERVQKSTTDPAGYMADIEKEQFSRDANMDIAILTDNKVPEERDEYDPGYLNYMNNYIASNKYAKLQPDAQQRITDFLKGVLEVATRTANIQSETANAATDQQGLDMGGVASMNPADPAMGAPAPGGPPMPPQAPPAGM